VVNLSVFVSPLFTFFSKIAVCVSGLLPFSLKIRSMSFFRACCGIARCKEQYFILAQLFGLASSGLGKVSPHGQVLTSPSVGEVTSCSKKNFKTPTPPCGFDLSEFMLDLPGYLAQAGRSTTGNLQRRIEISRFPIPGSSPSSLH
jgi:hypothetical protein